jgi:hypothetical protein
VKKGIALGLAALLTISALPAAGEDVQAGIPPEIRAMIELAAEQFDAHGGKTLKRSNEYTVWYYGDKTAIGWCAAFTSWCAFHAGVETLKEKQVDAFFSEDPIDMAYEPISDIPDVFMPREANVARCRNMFIHTGRLTDIPMPGYQIFYGRIGGAPTLHTGLVESVRVIKEGVYELTTLEGNVGNRVKRFCVRYTVEPKRKHHNLTAVPGKERVVENAQYKLHQEDWYITGFGQSW